MRSLEHSHVLGLEWVGGMLWRSSLTQETFYVNILLEQLYNLYYNKCLLHE